MWIQRTALASPQSTSNFAGVYNHCVSWRTPALHPGFPEMNKHQKADAVERMPFLEVAPKSTGRTWRVSLMSHSIEDFLKDPSNEYLYPYILDITLLGFLRNVLRKT
jgi:hypothetical protein